MLAKKEQKPPNTTGNKTNKLIVRHGKDVTYNLLYTCTKHDKKQDEFYSG